MDYNRIHDLLNKYWNCETDLQEEGELRLFFNDEDVPEDLQKYTKLFKYEKQIQQSFLDEKFDKRILEVIESKPKYRISSLLKIAAILMICISTALFFNRNQKIKVEDTYETPEQAYKEAEKVLLFLSGKINFTNDIVEENLVKMKETTKYIKL